MFWFLLILKNKFDKQIENYLWLCNERQNVITPRPKTKITIKSNYRYSREQKTTTRPDETRTRYRLAGKSILLFLLLDVKVSKCTKFRLITSWQISTKFIVFLSPVFCKLIHANLVLRISNIKYIHTSVLKRMLLCFTYSFIYIVVCFIYFKRGLCFILPHNN